MNNKIIRYFEEDLSPMEKEELENEIRTNMEHQKEADEFAELFDAFDMFRKKEFVKARLDEHHNRDNRLSESLKYHVWKYWKTAAVAASVAFIASVSTFIIAKKAFLNKDIEQVQNLGRQINYIKEQQKVIKEDIKEVKNNVVPDYPSNFAGTGFALTNNGYGITNLHVVSRGNKIFIFDTEGKAHRCEVVYRDAANDVAIIKTVDSSFAFSPNCIPYKLRSEADLAEEVFTLGYPKDEVVFNKGYVSSINGKNGDSTKYQLELPSSPGVSGAPVLDEQGNVIGMINSRESQSKGITYAIKSDILSRIFEEMPEDFKAHEVCTNTYSGHKRSSQIKQLENFVFIVKVYN